ncbi:hypothetical protein [Streptomyces scabiei]|uniref:hypothetical protein n=1 Tax=Streptomyces scabiei TaxID=1930 RepID=UPI0029AD493D|nr:hypothetical protein [Streptomyces scabiei]MDX3116865.1 hypothetical protein [Streptomyces scabiei]
MSDVVLLTPREMATGTLSPNNLNAARMFKRKGLGPGWTVIEPKTTIDGESFKEFSERVERVRGAEALVAAGAGR